jgi:hypothetical protein
MYTTLKIGNRSILAPRSNEVVYKIVFARPTITVGKGKSRREETQLHTLYCHATDEAQAVTIGKREIFSNMCDEYRYGAEFANTSVRSITRLLDGRVI